MAFTGWYQPINWDLRQQGKSPAEQTSEDIQSFVENQRRDKQLQSELQMREAQTAEFQAQALERTQKAQEEQEKNRKLAEQTKLEAEALAVMQKAKAQDPSLTQTQSMKILKKALVDRGLSTKELDSQYQKRLENVFKTQTPYELRKDVMDYWDMPYTREEYDKETRKVMPIGGKGLVDISSGKEVAPELRKEIEAESLKRAEAIGKVNLGNQQEMADYREQLIRSRPPTPAQVKEQEEEGIRKRLEQMATNRNTPLSEDEKTWVLTQSTRSPELRALGKIITGEDQNAPSKLSQPILDALGVGKQITSESVANVLANFELTDAQRKQVKDIAEMSGIKGETGKVDPETTKLIFDTKDPTVLGQMRALTSDPNVKKAIDIQARNLRDESRSQDFKLEPGFKIVKDPKTGEIVGQEAIDSSRALDDVTIKRLALNELSGMPTIFGKRQQADKYKVENFKTQYLLANGLPADTEGINQLKRKAGSKAIDVMTVQDAKLKSFAYTIKGNIDKIRETVKRLGASDAQFYNRISQRWSKELQSNPRLRDLDLALNTIAKEFANATSNPNMVGTTPQAMQLEMVNRLSTAMSYKDVEAVLDRMEQELNTRIESHGTTLNGLWGTMRDLYPENAKKAKLLSQPGDVRPMPMKGDTLEVGAKYLTPVGPKTWTNSGWSK